MITTKEVWYDVVYKDVTEKRPYPRTRSFLKRKAAQDFYDKLDSSRFDKYLILYEKSICDASYSACTKSTYEKEFKL